MPSVAELFDACIASTSLASREALAAGLGLVNQVLTIRQTAWCWPVGIASVAIYATVFFEAGLYSDTLLQLVYIALQLYGWHHWLELRAGHDGTPRRFLPISRLRGRGWWVLAGTVAAGTVLLGTSMRLFAGASLPYWDAGTTTLSLCAQWLQARKVLESWLVFIVANVLYIGIYAAKSLCFTIVLFAVLTVLAAFGYLRWYRLYVYERTASSRSARAAAK